MTKRHLNKSEEEVSSEEFDQMLDMDQFDTMRSAALVGKAAFPDQIDYFDPETGEIL